MSSHVGNFFASLWTSSHAGNFMPSLLMNSQAVSFVASLVMGSHAGRYEDRPIGLRPNMTGHSETNTRHLIPGIPINPAQ
jgi:hypothetical protein